jgi:sec-independent protein translocase protein TatA
MTIACTILAFMSFGFSELLLVGVVALLVFGGNLPDVMRTLGRNYARLRQSLNEFSRPVREQMREVTRLPPPDLSAPDVPPVTSSTEIPPVPDDQDEHPDFYDTLPDDLPVEDADVADAGDTAPPPPSGPEIDEPPPV